MKARTTVVALQASKGEHPPTDGRRRRSHDSQQRIVDGMLTLIAEGNHTPSAEQVSERAGVGLRSVFRHFNDMESLHRELSAVVAARLETVARQPFVATDWKGQLFELIERRAKVYETAAPFLEAGQIHRTKSAVLRANHAKFVAVLRSVMIERLPNAQEFDSGIVDGLDLLLSFESWQRLRRDQNLTATEAKATLQLLMTRLLSGVDVS